MVNKQTPKDKISIRRGELSSRSQLIYMTDDDHKSSSTNTNHKNVSYHKTASIGDDDHTSSPHNIYKMLTFTKTNNSKQYRRFGSSEPATTQSPLCCAPGEAFTMSAGGKASRKGHYDKGKGGKTEKAGRDAQPPMTEEQAILLQPWQEPEENTNLTETQKATIKWCRIFNFMSAMLAKLLDN